MALSLADVRLWRIFPLWRTGCCFLQRTMFTARSKKVKPRCGSLPEEMVCLMSHHGNRPSQTALQVNEPFPNLEHVVNHALMGRLEVKTPMPNNLTRYSIGYAIKGSPLGKFEATAPSRGRATKTIYECFQIIHPFHTNRERQLLLCLSMSHNILVPL
jgi:hypothetical protein